MELIFAKSQPGRDANSQLLAVNDIELDIPAQYLREQSPELPEMSELEVVRHYTRLSQLNFSIDTHFYPLGSCSMKDNPKGWNTYAMLAEFRGPHPLRPAS